MHQEGGLTDVLNVLFLLEKEALTVTQLWRFGVFRRMKYLIRAMHTCLEAGLIDFDVIESSDSDRRFNTKFYWITSWGREFLKLSESMLMKRFGKYRRRKRRIYVDEVVLPVHALFRSKK